MVITGCGNCSKTLTIVSIREIKLTCYLIYNKTSKPVIKIYSYTKTNKKTNITTYDNNLSFAISAIKLWYSLPNDNRLAGSLFSFETLLHIHFVSLTTGFALIDPLSTICQPTTLYPCPTKISFFFN